jgi:1-phosphatidylinositol-3-phosphate 5-kinase
VAFNAQGGKSSASFFKTADDKYILKQVSKGEVQMFHQFANAYFKHVSLCLD